MDLSILDKLGMEGGMEKDSFIIMMVVTMMVFGEKIRCMEEVLSLILMVRFFMKENGIWITFMEKDASSMTR